MPAEPAAVPLRARLRTDLRTAMKARDKAAVTVLRGALGAIDNAEAVEPARGVSNATGGVIAGAALGLGAEEATRRELSEHDVGQIVRAEVADRLAAADEYDEVGQTGPALRLRQEAEILEALLDQA